MGPEIAVELSTVRLFDDEDAIDAFKRRLKAFRLRRQEQSRGDEADSESASPQRIDCFPDCTRQRAPGEHGKFAVSFDARPVISVAELFKLAATFVELYAVIIFVAGGCPAFVMRETVSRILTAGHARYGHRRDAAGGYGITFVNTDLRHSCRASTDKGHIGRAIDCGDGLPDELIGEHDGRRLQDFGQISG